MKEPGHSPNEVLAVRTECRLLEEPRHEFVILDIVDILLLERAFPAARPETSFRVDVRRIIVQLVLGHRWSCYQTHKTT